MDRMRTALTIIEAQLDAVEEQIRDGLTDEDLANYGLLLRRIGRLNQQLGSDKVLDAILHVRLKLNRDQVDEAMDAALPSLLSEWSDQHHRVAPLLRDPKTAVEDVRPRPKMAVAPKPERSDDTDYYALEGIVPESNFDQPTTPVKREVVYGGITGMAVGTREVAEPTSSTPGVDKWRDLLRGSGEEDEQYYDSEDQGR